MRASVAWLIDGTCAPLNPWLLEQKQAFLPLTFADSKDLGCARTRWWWGRSVGGWGSHAVMRPMRQRRVQPLCRQHRGT